MTELIYKVKKKKKVSQFHVSQIIPDSTNFPENLDPNNRDAKNKIYINESLKSENRGRLKQARANANEQKYKYTGYIVKVEVKVKKRITKLLILQLGAKVKFIKLSSLGD